MTLSFPALDGTVECNLWTGTLLIAITKNHVL